MQYEEIQTAVDRLGDLMVDKQMVNPSVEFKILSHTNRIQIWFSWYNDAKQYKCEFFGGETPEEALAVGLEWVKTQPNKDERQRADYRQAVAHAIDMGNKFGIEDAAINPLREVMEKLSKNALEFHGQVLDLDSEIPF